MMITGNRMTSPNSPTSGESLANSDPQLNGISVIEPVKRSGDNRRVSSGNKSSEVVISESSLVNDREHELIMCTSIGSSSDISYQWLEFILFTKMYY